MSKYGFMSAKHVLNYKSKVQRNNNRKQPVKMYTGEELQKLADVLGYAVSPNHIPPQPKPSKKSTEIVEIEIEHIPTELMKFIKE